MDRLEQMVAHDLYFKWLGDELPNATACLRASTRVTVNEPYSLQGLWVSVVQNCRLFFIVLIYFPIFILFIPILLSSITCNNIYVLSEQVWVVMYTAFSGT